MPQVPQWHDASGVHDLKPCPQYLTQNRLLYGVDANMQLTINNFKQLFPDKIYSLAAVKFPDISRFSRQVVTLLIICIVYILALYCFKPLLCTSQSLSGKVNL